MVDGKTKAKGKREEKAIAEVRASRMFYFM